MLDRLIATSLWLAATCIVVIAVLVSAELAGRVVDSLLSRLGLPSAGLIVMSLPEIAGFLLAAAGFLGLASTLKAGAHIRVKLLLAVLPQRHRRRIELAALAVSAVSAGYLTWSVQTYAFYSWKFHELSTGLVPVEIWIPLQCMAIGSLVLTAALVQELINLASSGQVSFDAREDAVTLGKEG